MKTLQSIMHKPALYVIGLMSGTSTDGMDAVLTEITGQSTDIHVRQLSFLSVPYCEEERREILRLASGSQGGSHDLSLLHFYLGQKALDACLALCSHAGFTPDQIDLVGSHGHTIWHIPCPEDYLGQPVSATLQIGEASVIAEGLGCPVISDFRVRDMAAGGLGAPLVPYTEYLLYRREDQCIGLQNIGGIANLTVIPGSASLSDVSAFDTGPGNMLMDRLMEILTEGRKHFDEDGKLALSGHVSSSMLAWLLEDPYVHAPAPKTTGREHFGDPYACRMLEYAREHHLSSADLLATAGAFTCECIHIAVHELCRIQPGELIIGGGGSRNPFLMQQLRKRMNIPVLSNEDLGFDSQAKEAVAFAILASECLHSVCNNAPSATGAQHPVVMGKITQ